MNFMYKYVGLYSENHSWYKWDVDWVDWSQMDMCFWMGSCLIILFFSFAITVGFVGAKASVHSWISDDVIMNEVVKGVVF